ncbi:hypothetical protein [Kitasatospora indigofera]|uniref:hypothetical protein n=1 Tax=Kitasatospora indigofera TaxID=67307 RepID=UPI0032534859
MRLTATLQPADEGRLQGVEPATVGPLGGSAPYVAEKARDPGAPVILSVLERIESPVERLDHQVLRVASVSAQRQRAAESGVTVPPHQFLSRRPYGGDGQEPAELGVGEGDDDC